MQIEPQQQQIKYTKHEDVPEIFADGVRNVNFINGVVYAELTVTRVNAQNPASPVLEQHTSGRVILAPSATLQLQQGLKAITTAIQQQASQGNVSVPPQVPPAPSKPN